MMMAWALILGAGTWAICTIAIAAMRGTGLRIRVRTPEQERRWRYYIRHSLHTGRYHGASKETD